MGKPHKSVLTFSELLVYSCEMRMGDTKKMKYHNMLWTHFIVGLLVDLRRHFHTNIDKEKTLVM